MQFKAQAPSRRQMLGYGLAFGAGTAGMRSAFAQPKPVSMTSVGFETGADLAKAEAEGELVFYTHDSDPAGAAIVESFQKDFPKIRASYVRAQNGALYSKVLAERSAGRFTVDVMQFSELSTAFDFRRRGGYHLYHSPQAQFFDATSLSDPAGHFFYSGVSFAGIAYNTERVSEAEAPKIWKDLLDPRWRNAISTKQATSGMQFVQWLELKKLYGEGYWKEFSKQRPRGFDSRAQIFDRLAKGEDKICGLAEWAGYLLVKNKGAPVKFVSPPDGMPATPTIAGIVDKAPHPEAAKLFLDWLMSKRGQTLYQENPFLYYPSLRKDAPTMGDIKLADQKLLFPKDVAEYVDNHASFVKEWNGMMGL